VFCPQPLQGFDLFPIHRPMTIWHKEISQSVDSVVDNPDIVALYRLWHELASTIQGLPPREAFSLKGPMAHLVPHLMVLECEDHDFLYSHYGTEIQRHSQFDMTGRRVSEFGGELGEFFGGCYRRVLAQGEPLYTVHCSDRAKSVFTWERLILPLQGKDGRRCLKVYNRPLESRAQMLEVVLESSSDALLVLRALPQEAGPPLWLVVLVNERFARLAGASAQGASGHLVSEVFPDWAALDLEADCQAVLNSRRQTHERELRHVVNGTPRWYALWVGHTPDGCVVRLADITPLKLHELELEAQAQQLQADNAELTLWARLDGLTGLANRRTLDAFLAQECPRVRRHHTPLCVVMCDIDFFKHYNDLHGHLPGDDCIRAVAKLLASATQRPTDLVARFGGEEFVLVMPHTPLAGALEVVGHIREALTAQALSHGASRVSPLVTLSFGVAELPPGGTATPEHLLKLADDALYQAKQQGRDRAVAVRWP